MTLERLLEAEKRALAQMAYWQGQLDLVRQLLADSKPPEPPAPEPPPA